MAKISYHGFIFFIYIYHDFTVLWILCHVGITIMSEQCSQNNFHIIKTNPFKVTKYKKKSGGYLGQSGRR